MKISLLKRKDRENMVLTNNSERNRFTAVDLFSGGGGLTVGLKRVGFNVLGAVEIEPAAYATYKANHHEVHAFKQDIRFVTGQEILNLSPTHSIDLVAGCPPCQGFSSLTAKYRKDDPRNALIQEMTRLVREISPKAIMMENVPGLANKGRPLLNEFFDELAILGYKLSWNVLQVADYGVPQNRRRFVMLAGRDFDIAIPPPSHARDGKNGLSSWQTVQDIIKDMPEPITMIEATRNGDPRKFNWHVVRNITQTNKLRLESVKPGDARSKLPEKLRPDCHKGKDKGFSNVYGRLEWNKPSVTITGGCTTFSKGRFGHPEKNRTISVREAALLQTFPPEYFFDTPYMDYVCNIIGNALPCFFAETLARTVHDALVKHNESMAEAQKM